MSARSKTDRFEQRRRVAHYARPRFHEGAYPLANTRSISIPIRSGCLPVKKLPLKYRLTSRPTAFSSECQTDRIPAHMRSHGRLRTIFGMRSGDLPGAEGPPLPFLPLQSTMNFFFLYLVEAPNWTLHRLQTNHPSVTSLEQTVFHSRRTETELVLIGSLDRFRPEFLQARQESGCSR